ncbi:MAG: glycoside hydrolase family 2 protein, partial [Planctomycetota bacterium]
MNHGGTSARQPLEGDRWIFRAGHASDEAAAVLRGRAIDAVVPGCVHADLVRAGIVVHPDLDFAERQQDWVGRTDWTFGTRFVADPALAEHDRVELVCARLDTIATVELNGLPIGRAANEHHPHRFDVSAALRPGANELVVHLRGPVRHVEAEQSRLGTRPYNGDWGAYPFIRKAACNFGWDWGPRVATAGITGTIGLHAWSVARIRGVRPLVREADASRARVEVLVDLERLDGGGAETVVRVEVRGPDGAAVASGVAAATGGGAVVVPVEIERPRRWWPRGHGDQPLYRLDVRLVRDGRELDRAEARFGVRTVGLETAPDATGAPFVVLVNDRPVFCRGANWIPNQLFPAPVDRAAVRRRIEQAAGAGMNMLRVWGGGRYEDEAFYDRCDELGILVWQDFMFACATYPEDDPYPALVEAEARHQVARLCRHPSVALWCGGNENIWAHASWGFGEQLAAGQTWGRRYWRELLPAVVAELDPTRPYWPDSPWSGADDVHPNDADHGDRHTWDVSIEGYRTIVPRFASELGHQGPPNLATLGRALDANDLVIGSEAMHHRQRATGGNAKWYDGPLGEWFAAPEDFARWHYLAQLLQARAIGLAIEWHRANAPRCTGILFWQLNDCWAGHSWSAIDVDGRRKLLWYAARRAFADRLLTIQPVDGVPTVLAVND